MPSPTAPSPPRLAASALVALVATMVALGLLAGLPTALSSMTAWRQAPLCAAGAPAPTTSCVRVEHAAVLARTTSSGRSTTYFLTLVAPVAGRHVLTVGRATWSSVVIGGVVPVVTWGTAVTDVLASSGREETGESPRTQAVVRAGELLACLWAAVAGWTLLTVYLRRQRPAGPADLSRGPAVFRGLPSSGALAIRVGWAVAAALLAAFALTVHDARALAGVVLIASFTGIAAVAAWFSRRRLTLARDGVHVSSGGPERFIPWVEVRGVQRVRSRRGRNGPWLLRCSSGRPVTLWMYTSGSNAGDGLAPTVAAHAGRWPSDAARQR